MSDYLDPENEELLADFFIEAEMQMEIIERTILAIENYPGDRDALDELFRAVHTLKGGAYTVQMNELALFVHKVEDLLDEVRHDKRTINSIIIDLLLKSTDVIQEMFEQRKLGEIYTKDINELETQLVSFGEVDSSTREPVHTELDNVENNNLPQPLSRAEYDDLCQQAKQPSYRVRVHFDESNPMNTISAMEEFVRLRDIGTIWLTHPDFEEFYEENFFEYADFFLESSEDMSAILSYAVLPDVTLDIEIDILNEEMVEDAFIIPNNAVVLEEQEAVVLLEFPPQTDNEQASDEQIATDKVRSKGKLGVGDSINTDSSAAISHGVHDAHDKVVEAVNEGQSLQEQNEKTQNKVQPRKVKKETHTSVLRVDSRRVDAILKIISETVINKAAFNQTNSQLAEFFQELRRASLTVSKQIDTMIEGLLDRSVIIDLTNSSQDGDLESFVIRNLRKNLQDRARAIDSLLEQLDNRLKGIIGQFLNLSVSFSRNTNEVHEAVLRMRTVPIGQIFSRFPRLVRDLSHSLNKKAELILEGQETEIDKSMAEDLIDPLMHCIRNSMDHGIESAEERLQADKADIGRLKLAAFSEGNNIIIEISDDGGGISIERIKQKAIANNVIPLEKELSEQEAFGLIFDPDFSTAREVTNISGRGVGLDVVKKQIEKLNGTIHVWSKLGKGTRFTIRLPLTLAIMQGLLVRVRTETYAIPIAAVSESIRIKKEDIELIDNYEVVRVRDDIVPLLRLSRIFQLEESEKQSSNETMEGRFGVIVGKAEKRVGLVVDSLVGEEDLVIKPLVDRYTRSPGIAGATILGDGQVALILDVSQLVNLGIMYENFV